MLQCCLHVQGVPEHNGIGHQAKRIQLIFLPFTIRFTDFPSLPVADGAGNLVPALTPVQLGEDATPVDLVIDIVEQVDGPAISGGFLSAVISIRYILGFRKDNPNVFNMLVQNWSHC
jgi:hypothetical protein